jgi:hypothetical protein
MLIIGGVVIAYWVDYGFSYVEGSFGETPFFSLLEGGI